MKSTFTKLLAWERSVWAFSRRRRLSRKRQRHRPDRRRWCREETAGITAVADRQAERRIFRRIFFHFKMVVKAANGSVEREVEFTTKQKATKRLVRFVAGRHQGNGLSPRKTG